MYECLIQCEDCGKLTNDVTLVAGEALICNKCKE